ncbi:MAG: TIGR00730 family Rossman fold protein [bacterium]|nr:TIGR00730 family Rossman fold protein [bacterium]
MEKSIGKEAILDRKEMQSIARQRVLEISKEFTEGFKFLEDYPKSVTFFGANQFKEDNPYYVSARKLASRIIKELGYSVLSGGGPGIMEAANRGAFEAGGDSLGLLIRLPNEQVTNKYITGEFSSYYFFVRKVCLSFSAEAFIFYPGGFGTMDEFFEILTLIQTKKIANVPLICVGSEYWNSLRQFMEKEMAVRGTITPEDLNLFRIVDDHDEIIDIIRKVPVRVGMPFNGAGEKAELEVF